MTRQVALAYGGAVALFVAVLVALVIQVAAGRDPAIGPGEVAAAAPPKRVLVRRVIRRVVITDAAAPASAAPSPRAAAPAAPAAPAPAAAPAPVVTRAS